MHKVVAAPTQRREILECLFGEAIIGVVMKVVDGEPPHSSAHLAQWLSAIAETKFLDPPTSHGSPCSR
jgi:hypothetical protein